MEGPSDPVSPEAPEQHLPADAAASLSSEGRLPSTQDLHIQLPVVLSPLASQGSGEHAAAAAQPPAAEGGWKSPFEAADPPADNPPPAEDDPIGEEQETARPLERSSSAISRQSSQFLQPVRRSGVRVYAFGRGDCGQLGSGTADDAAAPISIDALQGKDVVSISCGPFHTAAVSGEREGVCCLHVHLVPRSSSLAAIWLWHSCLWQPCGYARFWCAGTASPAVSGGDPPLCAGIGALLFAQLRPHPPPRLLPGSLARPAGDGELYMFGSNDTAQLGLRGVGEQALGPMRLEALENFKVVSVGCGTSHTVAAVDDGGVAAWGGNDYGQCGQGADTMQASSCSAQCDAPLSPAML